MNILRQAKVNCKSCNLVVQLGNYIPHIDSQCARHMETLVTIFRDHLIHHCIHQSNNSSPSASSTEDNVMRVKTGGQVGALTSNMKTNVLYM